MTPDPDFEQEQTAPDTQMINEPEYRRQLRKVLRNFDEVYHLDGDYRLRFCVRELPDSDGTPVADVYLVPGVESRKNHDRNYFHIEIMQDKLPPELLGFVYGITITPSLDPAAPSWMTVDAETPLAEAGDDMTEEAILARAS